MNLDTGSSQEPGSVRKLSPGTLSHQLTLQLVSAPVLLPALLTAVPHTLTPAAQCDAPPAINTEISEHLPSNVFKNIFYLLCQTVLTNFVSELRLDCKHKWFSYDKIVSRLDRVTLLNHIILCIIMIIILYIHIIVNHVSCLNITDLN